MVYKTQVQFYQKGEPCLWENCLNEEPQLGRVLLPHTVEQERSGYAKFDF